MWVRVETQRRPVHESTPVDVSVYTEDNWRAVARDWRFHQYVKVVSVKPSTSTGKVQH